MTQVYHPYYIWEDYLAGMGDAWIMRHIGMDKDELLRLKQITGLAELFKDQEFSEAWKEDDTNMEGIIEDAIDE